MLVEKKPEQPETAANTILDTLNRHEGETLTKHTISNIMEEIWRGH